MAKAAMRPEVRAAKLRNNKAPILLCSVPGCEEEFFVAKLNKGRFCHPHFLNPPQESNKKLQNSLLFKLGLIPG